MNDAALFISSLPNQFDPVIRHKFVPGVYIRQMDVPAGSQILSKVHKTDHAFMLTRGRILVYDGVHEAVILKAPYTGVTLAGAQRIGIALEDVTWCNIHPTKIKPTDDTVEALEIAVSKIEKKVVEPFNKLLLKQ